jgi:transcriptional regulator with XRE-family HTH domain
MPTPIDPTKPLNANRFGALVRAYREERGWSQEELAQRWGFTRTYVSQIELGKRKLQYAEQVQRLADILEIPVEQLEAIGQAVPRQKEQVANWQESDDALLQALLEPAEATVKLAWLVWHANHDASMVGTLASLIEKLNQAIADRRGKYRRAALQILGYAHEMQGKIAFDQLDYPAAAGQFHEMYGIGEELSDADLTGLAMIHQGDVLRRRGRLEHAVRSLEAAQRYTSVGSIYTQGLRYLTLARAYAEAHQKEGFLRAIEQAQEAVTLVSPTLDTHANQFH